MRPWALCRGAVPVPQALQNNVVAETYAVLQLVQRAAPPVHMVLDCLGVVEDLRRGRLWCCRAGNPVAHWWAQIWHCRVMIGGKWTGCRATPRKQRFTEGGASRRWTPSGAKW